MKDNLDRTQFIVAAAVGAAIQAVDACHSARDGDPEPAGKAGFLTGIADSLAGEYSRWQLENLMNLLETAYATIPGRPVRATKGD
jgi:hypothetical protein